MPAEPWPLDRSFDWEGNEVRWTVRGSGPPVVFCHGTPWSSYVWREAAQRAVEDRTVFLWDMLGYGASDKPDADVSIGAQGRILASLLEDWDTGPVDIVAHDFGGAVALRAHLLHEAEFTSMLLADVVALRPWGSAFFRLVGEHPETFAGLPGHLHRALVGAYVAGASYRPVSSLIHEALVAPWVGAEGQPAFYRQIAQGDQRYTDEMEHLYGTISVPTLIVWGEEDDWVPVNQAQRLNQLIPGSRLRTIDKASHLVQEDRPNLFADMVADWLRENR